VCTDVHALTGGYYLLRGADPPPAVDQRVVLELRVPSGLRYLMGATCIQVHPGVGAVLQFRSDDPGLTALKDLIKRSKACAQDAPPAPVAEVSPEAPPVRIRSLESGSIAAISYVDVTDTSLW